MMIDGVLLAITRISIERNEVLMSLAIDMANKNPENPNDKLHAMYRSGNIAIGSSKITANRNPIGLFQSNGNLFFVLYFVRGKQRTD